jgi:hypothetical protein
MGRHGVVGAKVLWAVVLSLLLMAIPALAQLPTGTILGTVNDSSGAVVPGATITAKNVDTGFTRTVSTDSGGSYRISALPVGNYQVDITQQGFSKETRSGLTLAVGQEAVVNVTLNIGTTAQTVEITGEAPQVNTTDSTLGGLVTEQKLEDLPLNGRNYLDLTSLQSGVSSVGSTEGQVRGLGGDIFSTNGAPMRSNNFLLDGAILQNAYGMNPQSVAKTSLGTDGIKEFKTITDLFSADYGLVMGAQITMVSKGGTNQFHGDAYEFVRNSDLDAKNYFDSGTIPHFERNQFGGAFGGPIKKDKTFFWGVYEGLRETLGLTELDTVPGSGCHGPAGAIIWNGVGTPPPGTSNVNNPCPVAQLGTNLSGPGTVGPNAVMINATTAPLLNVLPNPNLPNNKFTFSASEPTSVNYGQMRIDHNISSTDSLFGRYTVDQALSSNPVNYPTVHDTLKSLSQYLTLSENHIFSSSVINTFRASYSRTGFVTTSRSTLTSPSFVKGQPTGSFSFGAAALKPNYGPEAVHGFIKQNILSFSDDIFWNKGRNAFKFGTLINNYGQGIDQGFFSYGTIAFSTLSNFLQDLVANTTYTPAAASENRYYRYWTLGFYIQDDIRVTRRFTANLGLRYEFNTTPIEMNGKQAAFRGNFATDTATTPGPVVRNPSLKSFSPRVGFAWDLFGDGKTSLRGGAGLYYDIANIGALLQQDASGTPPLSYQGGGRFNKPLPILVLPLDVFQPLACPPCTGVQLSTTAYNIDQPYNLQYSLTVERQLPWSTALGVSYVGSRGIHLYSDPEGNPAKVTRVINGQKFWDPFDPNYGPINPNFSDDSLFTTTGDTWYNSLQVQVTKRVSHGLEFQSSYTYSKLISTPTGQTANQDLQTFNSSDPFNPKTDRGPDELNLTHQEKFNMLYHFPIIKTDNGILSKLVNGWWTGSIVTLQSGFNFSPTLGFNQSNDLNNQSDRPDVVTAANVAAVRAGTYSRNGVLAGANPNAVPFNRSTVITGNIVPSNIGLNASGTGFTSYGWFNPNMFIPGPPGFLGNASRGMLVGPGFRSWDFSLVKDTKVGFLGEAGNLQFRAEFFNILNHPNFGPPSNVVYDNGPSFVSEGVVNNHIANTQADGSAGAISSTGVLLPRQIQFGLRIEF